jgi:iron complex transport system substrate-binding protein
MKYIFALALCFSLAVLPALGLEGFPKTIVDSANRTVIINEPVERIVPMVTWSYEPVWLLGAQNKVAGVTIDAKDSEYPWLNGMNEKPAIGTYKELDYEKIADIHPQVIIVLSKLMASKKVDEEKLRSLGISVVVLDFNNQETFDTEFRTLAKILEKDEEAEEFLSWKNGHLNQIKEKVKRIDPIVRVYGEWTYSPWLTSAAGSSGLHEHNNYVGRRKYSR